MDGRADAVVLFGATGDLVRKKLLPALWREIAAFRPRAVLDLCSGSGVVSYMLKAQGCRVHANDYMAMATTVARALIAKPQLILADEPTGALDSATSRQIMDLLTEIHRTGITVLIVTHDPEVAARCQRTIRLRDGKVVDDLEDPQAASAGAH